MDFGCNSWFIRKDWLREMWRMYPYTLDTGEDIHLSAELKNSLGVGTLVPSQKDETVSGNLKKVYGQDEIASWKTHDFLQKRSEIIHYLVQTTIGSR